VRLCVETSGKNVADTILVERGRGGKESSIFLTATRRGRKARESTIYNYGVAGEDLLEGKCLSGMLPDKIRLWGGGGCLRRIKQYLEKKKRKSHPYWTSRKNSPDVESPPRRESQCSREKKASVSWESRLFPEKGENGRGDLSPEATLKLAGDLATFP